MSRRQRRSQQNSSSNADSIKTVDDIPYARPTDTKDKPTRTLLEIAAEKQAQLQPGSKKFTFDPATSGNVVNVKIDEKGNVIPSPSSSASTQPPSNNSP